MAKTFLFPVSVVCAVMIEVGSVLVMTGARPDATAGFWAWFLGLCVLAPLFPIWMHRQLSRAAPAHDQGSGGTGNGTERGPDAGAP